MTLGRGEGYRLGVAQPLFGEAVFLEAAAGFVGDGALDESGFEGGAQVVRPEGRSVGELELFHAVQRRPGVFGEHPTNFPGGS